jgi:hypothetical protein
VHAEVAVGARSFGDSQRATVDYTFRNGTLLLNYVEEPATNTDDRYNTGGPLSIDDPSDYLFSLATIERYLLNRLDFRFEIEATRTNFSVGAFDEDRLERTSIIGEALPDETQSGVDMSVGWALGARTDLSLDIFKVRRDFGDGNASVLTTLSLRAEYTLGPRTDLLLTLEKWHEEPIEGEIVGNYRANLISLRMIRTF